MDEKELEQIALEFRRVYCDNAELIAFDSAYNRETWLNVARKAEELLAKPCAKLPVAGDTIEVHVIGDNGPEWHTAVVDSSHGNTFFVTTDDKRRYHVHCSSTDLWRWPMPKPETKIPYLPKVGEQIEVNIGYGKNPTWVLSTIETVVKEYLSYRRNGYNFVVRLDSPNWRFPAAKTYAVGTCKVLTAEGQWIEIGNLSSAIDSLNTENAALKKEIKELKERVEHFADRNTTLVNHVEQIAKLATTSPY